jgi:hypothetical protein
LVTRVLVVLVLLLAIGRFCSECSRLSVLECRFSNVGSGKRKATRFWVADGLWFKEKATQAQVADFERIVVLSLVYGLGFNLRLDFGVTWLAKNRKPKANGQRPIANYQLLPKNSPYLYMQCFPTSRDMLFDIYFFIPAAPPRRDVR